ncbi:MAG: signal recognition particle-docking protein FtsY [Thermoproteota archaeon]|nr:signal recognition particle-docking protein FtsY [Candidatus Brockarchaeota archaeon]
MKISELFKSLVETISTRPLGRRELEKVLDEYGLKLITCDVALPFVEELKNRIIETLEGQRTPLFDKNAVKKVVEREIEKFLLETLGNGFDLIEEAKNSPKPFKLLFIGVNGVGKTTTIAKVAYMFKKAGLSVILACSDTFRAGAVEQLSQHAKSLGLPIITKAYGSDPASVGFEAVSYALSKGVETVLIDTAGRMHTDINLMDELKKIKRVVEPSYTILVVDALTGNDAWNQASDFQSHVGYDAIILAKFDADEKGGAALSVSYVSKKPVIYVGTGQKYSDLERFNPEKYVKNLLSGF